MAVIKCKMCGGSLNIADDSSVCECEYCGTRQTVPKADDEKKLTLFGRAGKLLRACEFDKAAGVFESIVSDFPEEAEAYWGLVLCKYGIEYVDDPATGRKIPTCHRSSFESVEDDQNFEQACENADAVARRVYRDEARQIEGLRKRILEVSGKEEPYDVFISYKETDEEGERTPDSVIAQDIFKALTNEGYRVFFSRISLEGKLGVEYEPYIFAALNSAKVLLAVGMDYEYFDAVWVKNEWGRFLKLIAAGQPKTLIPVYKDMDPYDMPKELRSLAAQNMGKIGAMQDLLHGIEKIVGKKKPEPQVIVQSGANVGALLKRGFMSLEDAQWDKATELFDKVLNDDPENAQAYLGLAMAQAQSRTRNELRSRYIEPSSKLRTNPSLVRAGQFSEELGNWFAQLKAEGEKADKERRAEQERERLAAWQKARDAEKARKRAEEAARIEREKKAEEERLAREKRAEEERLEREKKAEEERIEQERKAEEERTAREKADAARRAAEEKLRIEKEQQKAFRLKYRKELSKILYGGDLYYSAALKPDGTVLLAGKNYRGQAPDLSGWRDICLFDIATDYAVGVTEPGEILLSFAGGEDKNNRRFNLNGWKKIRALAADGPGIAGLKADGTVCYQGHSQSGQANVSSWRNITAIDANLATIVGLQADGTVVAAGDNSHGECEVGGWTDVAAIAAGSYHTIGLKSDGTVAATQYRNNTGSSMFAYQGQCDVGGWHDIVAIAAGAQHSVGLRADGSVVAVGSNASGQCSVQEWKDVIAIAAGSSHTLGLRADGTILAAGANKDGQCGLQGKKLFYGLEELKQKWEEAAARELALRQEKINALKDEKTRLQAELPTIKGLFAGSKKAKIEARLAEIEAELKTLG